MRGRGARGLVGQCEREVREVWEIGRRSCGCALPLVKTDATAHRPGPRPSETREKSKREEQVCARGVFERRVCTLYVPAEAKIWDRGTRRRRERSLRVFLESGVRRAKSKTKKQISGLCAAAQGNPQTL